MLLLQLTSQFPNYSTHALIISLSHFRTHSSQGYGQSHDTIGSAYPTAALPASHVDLDANLKRCAGVRQVLKGFVDERRIRHRTRESSLLPSQQCREIKDGLVIMSSLTVPGPPDLAVRLDHLKVELELRVRIDRLRRKRQRHGR